MKQELFYLIEALKLEKNDEKLENIKVFKEYFQDFFRKYPARDFFKNWDISFEDLIFSLVLISNPFEAKECLKMLHKYQNIVFDFKHSDELAILLNYVNNDEFYQLVRDLNSKNIFVRISALNRFETVGQRSNISLEEIQSFLYFLHDNPTLVSDVVPFLTKISTDVWDKSYYFYTSLLAFRDVFMELEMKKSAINRTLKKMIDDQDESVMMVINYSDYLYSSYSQALKDVNKELKEINKNNKSLDELIRLLNVDGEIKNIDYLLSLCPNLNIQELVVDYVISVNQKYNDRLWEQYQDLKVNSDENIERLLEQYGYDYALYSEEERIIMKEKKYEQLEAILKSLNTYVFFVHEKELLGLSFDKLNDILSFVQSDLFSCSFVEQYINELINPKTFSLIKKNIQMLSLDGIHMANYHDSLDILFDRNLENNLSLLKQYGLSIKRDTTHLNFLNDSETVLAFKIDLLIEMGYYDSLNISLNLLNLSKEELKNKKILEQLNISGDVSLVLDSNAFFLEEQFIKPEYLSLLQQNSLRQASLPEEMSCFQINNYVLLIHNVFVSMPRFIRNLSKFREINNEIILVSILYQGHYTLEEIESLIEVFLPNQEPFLLVRR